MNNDKTIYFPGLNGLRALSALAVVLSHLRINMPRFFPALPGDIAATDPSGLPVAGFGVSVFFVLSGFLITYLLQAERAQQTISIRKFYLRRILRIWPLYYAYLLVAVLVILAMGTIPDLQALLYYCFFAANIPFLLGIGLTNLHHYWSLGVEEQFYLFWPWVNRYARQLLPVTGLLIVLLIGAKTILHLFYPGSFAEAFLHVSRFHCMLIGAFGALLYRSEHGVFLRWADNPYTQAACWFVFLLAGLNRFHIASFLDNELISVVALFVIIGQIGIKNRIVNLERPVFDFLGKISFGIYVIHPLVIFGLIELLPPLNLQASFRYLFIYILVIGLTIGLAYLSYDNFERYFLGLKKRFEVVKSKASGQQAADTAE